mmetsp:Transcript_48824/g.122276  ORF Transcript_48824/g.122276 Transcript_48824/m.122276 type:complete len:94 (-) Transcript_48824:1543-1824(-)
MDGWMCLDTMDATNEMDGWMDAAAAGWSVAGHASAFTHEPCTTRACHQDSHSLTHSATSKELSHATQHTTHDTRHHVAWRDTTAHPSTAQRTS